MKVNRLLAIGGLGATALFFGVTTQQTDVTSKDKEQLESVVREVVKSEFDKQKDSIKQMVHDVTREAVKDEIKKNIGFVDAGHIFENMNEFKDQKVAWQAQFAKDQEELQTMGKSIVQKEQEMASMGNAMSKQAKENKEAEIASLRVKGELKARNLQEHYSHVEQEVQMQLLKEIQAASDEFRVKEGKVIVLAGGIASADPSINVSGKVLDTLNKRYEQKKKNEVANGPKAKKQPTTVVNNSADSTKQKA